MRGSKKYVKHRRRAVRKADALLEIRVERSRYADTSGCVRVATFPGPTIPTLYLCDELPIGPGELEFREPNHPVTLERRKAVHIWWVSGGGQVQKF